MLDFGGVIKTKQRKMVSLDDLIKTLKNGGIQEENGRFKPHEAAADMRCLREEPDHLSKKITTHP